MKLQPHDAMLAICLISVTILSAMERLDPANIMTVIAGILGYATRATVSK